MPRSSIALDMQPMAEINTTPLIDVMLVLLIMFILTIPVASHVVEVGLPGDSKVIGEIRQENTLAVRADGTTTWNGVTLTRAQLLATMKASLSVRPEPLLRYEPDSQAPYAATAEVLALVKQSGVEAFAFVGNERFANFGKAPPR